MNTSIKSNTPCTRRAPSHRISHGWRDHSPHTAGNTSVQNSRQLMQLPIGRTDHLSSGWISSVSGQWTRGPGRASSGTVAKASPGWLAWGRRGFCMQWGLSAVLEWPPIWGAHCGDWGMGPRTSPSLLRDAWWGEGVGASHHCVTLLLLCF